VIQELRSWSLVLVERVFCKVISEIKNGMATDLLNKVKTFTRNKEGFGVFTVEKLVIGGPGILKGRGVGIPPFLTPKP
jgi:hypothetical protein